MKRKLINLKVQNVPASFFDTLQFVKMSQLHVPTRFTSTTAVEPLAPTYFQVVSLFSFYFTTRFFLAFFNYSLIQLTAKMPLVSFHASQIVAALVHATSAHQNVAKITTAHTVAAPHDCSRNHTWSTAIPTEKSRPTGPQINASGPSSSPDLKIDKWMLDTADQEGEMQLASKPVGHLTHYFRNSNQSDSMTAIKSWRREDRWFQIEMLLLGEEITRQAWQASQRGLGGCISTAGMDVSAQ